MVTHHPALVMVLHPRLIMVSSGSFMQHMQWLAMVILHQFIMLLWRGRRLQLRQWRLARQLAICEPGLVRIW